MSEHSACSSRSRRWVVAAGVAALVAVALMARPVAGQFGGWTGPAAPGGPGAGGPMPGMMPGMGPMAPAAAIAVADEKVYVVLGATVYKLDAGTLEVENQQVLVHPPQAGPPMAPAPER